MRTHTMDHGPMSAFQGVSRILQALNKRQIVEAFGLVLALAGVTFTCLELGRHSISLETLLLSTEQILNIIALAAVYGLACSLLALGWWSILAASNVALPPVEAVSLYARSQIAKYVPGNIFQFAALYMLGLAAGLPAKTLLKSTAIEVVCLLSGAALLAILVVPGTDIAQYDAVALAGFSTVFVLLCWILAFVHSRWLAVAFVCYVSFLALAGIVFAISAQIIGSFGVWNVSVLQLVGAYTIAWAAGLATPGAPAGLGVREAVLIILLNAFASPESVVEAVVVGRLITVGGDFLFFVSGNIMRPRSQRT